MFLWIVKFENFSQLKFDNEKFSNSRKIYVNRIKLVWIQN